MYAEKTLEIFLKSFNAQMLGMDKLNKKDGMLGMNLFITSTFGNGDPPAMALKFSQWLESVKRLSTFKIVPQVTRLSRENSKCLTKQKPIPSSDATMPIM